VSTRRGPGGVWVGVSRVKTRMGHRGADFDEFVLGHSGRLLRSAVLLLGDREDAEDLLQEVLERMYAAWQRIDDPTAYAHRAVLRAAINRWRRRRRRPQVPLGTHDVATSDPTASVSEREPVLDALRCLPARQRAVLVLRYFEDLSEAQVADVLGCSTGTVKRHASRGLQRLRDLLDDPAVGLRGTHHAP
jgi:RNA polymerase sigma-70 factor (sigma-E family)